MEQEKKAYTKEEFLEVVKNHEEIANKIRKENQVHLDGFEAWLTAKGLAKKGCVPKLLTERNKCVKMEI